MGNNLTEEDYLVAYNIITDQKFLLEDIKDFEPDKNLSPEKILIKKEEYNNLSNEAKEVINIILFGPTEIFAYLMNNVKNTISKRKVRLFLEKYFNSKFIADYTIEEIERWVNQL